MRLLLGIEGHRTAISKQFIASFLLHDQQMSPSILGLEYTVNEGILRTFIDAAAPDFYQVLQRSGLMQEALRSEYRAPCLLCVPYLGKGVPEQIPAISQLLAINDHGKQLFLAWQETGQFRSLMFDDPKFEQTVRSFF